MKLTSLTGSEQVSFQWSTDGKTLMLVDFRDVIVCVPRSGLQLLEWEGVGGEDPEKTGLPDLLVKKQDHRICLSSFARAGAICVNVSDMYFQHLYLTKSQLPL